MTTGIYVIKNKVNSKIYIGSAVDIESRWNSHKSQLRKDIHCNSFLQRAWNKYGEDSFEFSIICKCKSYAKIDFEGWFVKEFNPEYNLIPVRSSGGMPKNLWQEPIKWSEEAKARHKAALNEPEKVDKMSKRMKEFHRKNPEVAKNHSILMKERAKDPENIKQLSEAALKFHAADPSIASEHSKRMKGIFSNPAHREKMSKILTEVWKDPVKLARTSETSKRQFSDPNQRIKMARAKGGFPVRCKETGEVFQTVVECAIKMNLKRPNLVAVLKGRRPKVGGYSFEYVKD